MKGSDETLIGKDWTENQYKVHIGTNSSEKRISADFASIKLKTSTVIKLTNIHWCIQNEENCVTIIDKICSVS